MYSPVHTQMHAPMSHCVSAAPSSPSSPSPSSFPSQELGHQGPLQNLVKEKPGHRLQWLFRGALLPDIRYMICDSIALRPSLLSFCHFLRFLFFSSTIIFKSITQAPEEWLDFLLEKRSPRFPDLEQEASNQTARLDRDNAM